MYLQKRILLTAALALLPVDRCSAQFFTPVSTTMEAETWYFFSGDDYTPYSQATVQGPDDNEDFGNQTGTLQVSSELSYSPFANFVLTGTATGSVTIDPSGGTIAVTLSAIPGTTSAYPNQLQGSVTATVVFDVPPGSGIDLGFEIPTMYNFDWSTSELVGPDGLSWFNTGSLNIPSVPAGEYTLTFLARTQTVTGAGYGGDNFSTIQIFPEPVESALAIGVMSLLPLRRRRA